MRTMLLAQLMIKSPYVFYGASGLLVAYVLYMVFRKRKGERPGHKEPDIL